MPHNSKLTSSANAELTAIVLSARAARAIGKRFGTAHIARHVLNPTAAAFLLNEQIIEPTLHGRAYRLTTLGRAYCGDELRDIHSETTSDYLHSLVSF